jgi:uncharacterized protein (TIGR02246 family)
MRTHPTLPLFAGLSAIALIVGGCLKEPDEARSTSATGSVTSDAEARDAIRRQSARMTALWPSENVDSIVQLFADDAVAHFPEMPDARGHAAIREQLRGAFGGVSIQSLEAQIDTIDVLGDVAYEWGHYRERYTETGKPGVVADGRYVMRWARQADGSWRVTRFTANTAKEEPATASGARR